MRPHPRNFARALRFVGAKHVYLPNPATGRDGDASSVFGAVDSSVTGTANAVVTANNAFLAEPTCLGSPRGPSRRLERLHMRPSRHASLGVGTEDGGATAIKPLRLTQAEDGKA